MQGMADFPQSLCIGLSKDGPIGFRPQGVWSESQSKILQKTCLLIDFRTVWPMFFELSVLAEDRQ